MLVGGEGVALKLRSGCSAASLAADGLLLDRAVADCQSGLKVDGEVQITEPSGTTAINEGI